VDKLFSQTMAALGFQIPAKRLGGGYYTLGSKKIFCKIISQRLVVRVGGGFMAIEEFLQQYGQFESNKYTVVQ
jgi:Growth-Arrest-Specific Protein 2 Domain